MKITLLFLSFFVFSACLLFVVIYLLFSKALTSRDHEIIKTKFQEMSLIYQTGGAPAFEKYFKDSPSQKNRSDFYFRIRNQDGKTIFLRTPLVWEGQELSEVEKALLNPPPDAGIIYIKTSNEENDVEIMSSQMSDGSLLSVGKGVDDRDDLFELFERIFSIVLVLTLVLGGAGGLLFSNHLLKPLRELINTIRNVSRGDESARVLSVHTGDELNELTLLFNQMLDHVQQSNQAMRQTLDTVAHDLRTPLTSVRGQVELALQKTDLSEVHRELLENCIEGIDEALYEFKIMTDIAEVEAGLKNLRLQNTSARKICEQVVDLYEIVAEQKSIQLVLTGHGPCLLECDSIKIRQAVANLVDNAIKYSPENRQIHIGFAETAEEVLIQVQDQGIGIPANEISQIFKRLYRGENSRHEKGLGLGLSLVRFIVEAHGGRIQVKSHLGEGSFFEISLPKKI